jgi:ABC-type uncharacterized transport system permease subunit
MKKQKNNLSLKWKIIIWAIIALLVALGIYLTFSIQNFCDLHPELPCLLGPSG